MAAADGWLGWLKDIAAISVMSFSREMQAFVAIQIVLLLIAAALLWRRSRLMHLMRHPATTSAAASTSGKFSLSAARTLTRHRPVLNGTTDWR